MEQLLATKFYVPSTRLKLVSRPHLLELLSDGLHSGNKLTLISAPAGFGKTTLVTEWLDNLKGDTKEDNQNVCRIAWLSLDKGDNDPTRFLIYFITALNRVSGIDVTFGKGALGMLQSPQPPPSEVVLTSLINDIAAIPCNIIFVLDDYHLIEEQPIHAAIVFLLEHLPPQLHLVISTREDPRLNLPRLRARNQLTELRAADLRFTASESAEFLNQVMGLNLSTTDITVLKTRTEGWIVGLQMAAISMQRLDDASSFIQSFTGSHRLVIDYLIEEVLNQQSANVQNFLLQTAILESLTNSLCNAVTGQDDGQAILEMLERTNLFIIPLDNERHWYRYHHLFAEILRQRLRQTQPEKVPILHQIASEWYERNGFQDKAIEHSMRCENYERAAELIEYQVDVIWGRGEYNKVFRWLKRLPVKILLSKPKLCIYDAWNQFISGQQDAAEERLQAAEHALANSTKGERENIQEQNLNTFPVSNIPGRTATIRAELAFFRGDLLNIEEYARLALELLPLEDLSYRSAATATLGDAYALRGDLENAYDARFKAVELGKASKNHYLRLIAIMKLSITLRQQGRLQEVGELFEQELQLAEKNGMSSIDIFGCINVIWGEVLAEYNDLDEAIDLARQGMELTEHSRDLGLIGWAYSCLIRIMYSKQDYDSIEEIYQKAEKINQELGLPPWAMDRLDSWKPRIWLAKGNLDDASSWIQELGKSVEREISYQKELENIAFARVLIAQNNLEEVIPFLQRLFESASAGERTPKMIEILALQAITHQMADNTDLAISALGNALDLAQPRGFFRIFVDEGPPMARLLYEALNRGIKPEYVSRLLKAFPTEVPEQVALSRTQDSQSGLLEPLSEREFDVLQLIAEGLTNPEIATRLFLSLHTVKTHTRNIYGKLDAHNRMEAVAKARAFGVLPPT